MSPIYHTFWATALFVISLDSLKNRDAAKDGFCLKFEYLYNMWRKASKNLRNSLESRKK